MNVVVNGLMTNYVRTGRGKIILCLPGWGETVASFAKLIEDLKDDYMILALDLPGFGGTQAPDRAWDLEDYAKFTADFLKKIKAGKVYSVIGHSYGGSTAVMAMSNGKIKADKLVLLASAGIRHETSLHKAMYKTVAKASKLPLLLFPRHSRNKLRKKFYGAIGSDMMLLPHMEPTFRKIISQDVRPAAESVTAKTLLIYGSQDSQTPARDGQLLANTLPNSRLEIIKNAGHFLHQDNIDEAARLIKHFLREK